MSMSMSRSMSMSKSMSILGHEVTKRGKKQNQYLISDSPR
jgi:hypothetical protein